MEVLSINWPDMAARAAYLAAAAAAGVLDDSLDAEKAAEWPWLSGPTGIDGDGNDLTRAGVQSLLFRFVIDNPTAPAEALFRFAAAREIHDLWGDAWGTIPQHWRVAYEVFGLMAPQLHMRFGELAELDRLDDMIAATQGPPLASALTDVPVEDTILAPHPDPLATNPNMALVMQASGAAAVLAAEPTVETPQPAPADEPAQPADPADETAA